MLDGYRRQADTAHPRPRPGLHSSYRNRLRPHPWLAALLLASLAPPAPARAMPDPPPPQSQAPDTPPATVNALTRQINHLLADPAVARAHWGIAVSTLDGHPLLAIDADKLFHPASNAKLFTTAAAMALLGPEATVTTRIQARGPINASTLTGDLALIGAGDADFATDDVPYKPPDPRHGATAHAPPPIAEAPSPPPLRALEAMADSVVTAGVRTITGDVVGDDTAFAWEPYPEDWAQDDLLWGYGAPVSGLALHDNQIALYIRPGPSPGTPALAAFEPGMPPWFTLDTTGLTTGPPRSGTHVGIGNVPGSPRALRVWGTIASHAPAASGSPADVDSADAPADTDDIEQIALPDPALFAAEALRAMLLARGVTITGTARAEHRLPLATVSLREQAHQPLGVSITGAPPPASTASANQTLATAASPTLLADETATNKLSQNLHAELLLERLGKHFGLPDPARLGEHSAEQPSTEPEPTKTSPIDPASRAQGVRVVRSILPLADIDPDDIILVDGSGLSTHDLVTPRAVVHLLTWAGTQPWFAGWRSTLPIGGVDGSLAGRFPKPPLTRSPLTGRVVAKTGTLGEARALSGYLTCASGRTVAFSILVDNHAPGTTADRDATDRLIAAIYAAL